MILLLENPPLGLSPYFKACAEKCRCNWCPLSLLSLPTQLLHNNACVHHQVILKSLNVNRTEPMPHLNIRGTLQRLSYKRQPQGLKAYRVSH